MYKIIDGYDDGIRACIPASPYGPHLDIDSMIDTTRVGDMWRRYFDPNTGEQHDCAEYAKQTEEYMGKQRTPINATIPS